MSLENRGQGADSVVLISQLTVVWVTVALYRKTKKENSN